MARLCTAYVQTNHDYLLFFHVEQLFRHRTQTGKFQPEYAGKLNFYVARIDDKLKLPVHAETVGVLICGGKGSVRYALARSDSHTWPLPPTPMNHCRAKNELSAAFDQIENRDRRST